VTVPGWIWIVFLFAFGCCVGSFLNVVIYRLPRDKSVISPPSSCPACGKRISFYDNIPLISWLVLGRKCRHCKAPISPRYFVVELLTGVLFAGLFVLYFQKGLWSALPTFGKGGWLIYLVHLTMLAGFVAASAIDLELWVIPLSICWVVTAAGLLGSAVGGYVIEPSVIRAFAWLPRASGTTAALAVGAAIGLLIAWLFLAVGLVKRSYESEDRQGAVEQVDGPPEQQINHRLEICKELLFLLPIVLCAAGVFWLTREVEAVHRWWTSFSQHRFVAGLLGSLYGYFVGCGIVWATRIFGTFAFGKEAMGLGDVHLMGAAGAVVGPIFVVAAFFIAPFFGLAWAALQMLSKKTRQIPYGPFLSLGVFAVMILHDWILNYWSLIHNR
jgi:leader peptidase (prepilin peptidase)/N-methyltransferase